MSVPPELLAEALKMVLGWGLPGLIILFLLEERRRLLTKVDTLQDKVIDEMKARLDAASSFMGMFRDYEKSFESLTSTVNTLLAARVNRRSSHD